MRFLGKTLSPIALLLAGLGMTVGAFAGGHSTAEGMEHDKNIVEVATEAGSFSTLLAALEATDLTGVLEGEGPFTVFAPTDEAFAALPEGALDSLLANPDQLAKILTMHVVSGEARAADVVNLAEVTTVEGSALAIDTADGVSIGGAKVVAADVEAGNGVIHVIDRVILPAS
ncbi:MAG: fasciclin domain-containing protein [Pseudomonadota bacterium]